MRPKSIIGADKGYSGGEFIDALIKERIEPHIPILDYRSQNDRGIYPIEKKMGKMGPGLQYCDSGNCFQ
jgi:hypothetical protein